MRTNKRISTRNSSRERATPKSSKPIENTQVSELITSSVKKNVSGRRKFPVTVTVTEIGEEDEDGKANDGVENENGEGSTETLFSPSFHSVVKRRGETDHGDSAMAGPASLRYQSSKLECVEDDDDDDSDYEEGDEECYDYDGEQELEDFDPYVFIRNLPELSTVVPEFRRTLLPKKTRSCPEVTLVLDLDETLVHSTLEPCENADFSFCVSVNSSEHVVFVRCRPYLAVFMERVSAMFEIIVFTASQSAYADQLLNVLDPRRRIFRHRVFRDSCIFVDGNYLKDLSVLGRDLCRTVIVDNSPQAFGFQVDNGIPIESWFEDPADDELLRLLPFLETLLAVEDVRPLIARKFNLRQRVTAAAHHSVDLARGFRT